MVRIQNLNKNSTVSFKNPIINQNQTKMNLQVNNINEQEYLD